MSLAAGESYEYVIERSRFIAQSFYVTDEQEVNRILAETRKKYSDATHNCYAYVLAPEDNVIRFSDDGEPAKTAGMPILEVLRARQLYCALVIVTRYFGGIKLGAGGLVRAYANGAAGVLQRSDVKRYVLSAQMQLTCAYDRYKQVLFALEKAGAAVSDSNFAENITVTFTVNAAEESRIVSLLADITGGDADVKQLGTKYCAENN